MFKNKTLLITGGTGSFGNAVLNRFLNSDIKEIKIFLEKRKVEALNLITQVENNPEIMDVELLEETLKLNVVLSDSIPLYPNS